MYQNPGLSPNSFTKLSNFRNSLRQTSAMGLGLALCLSSVAQAQTVPDAGAAQQQIERGLERPLLPKAQDLTRAQKETPAATEGPTLQVRKFIYRGNTLLDAKTLDAALAPFLQQPQGFAGLQAAAAAAAEAYRKAGWLVQAILPPQDVTEGTVIIEITEARLGEVKIQEDGQPRVKPARVLAYFNKLRPGEHLSVKTMDRALLLAGDLPGIGVSGTLEASKQQAHTDLSVTVTPEPLLSGQVGLDNSGSRAYGNNRATASLNLNSPLGIGDLLSTDLIHSQGMDYARASYSVPVGSDGWRIGAWAAGMDAKVITSDFSALRLRSSYRGQGLQARYPLIRERMQNLYLDLGADNKNYDNKSIFGTTSHYEITTMSAGLSGNIFDASGTGSYTTGSLTLLNGHQRPLSRDPNAIVKDDFSIMRFYLSRQQVITDAWRVSATLSGQWADKNLDSSERFYLGGPYGVRAYPVSEAGGSSGAMLNLELQRLFAHGFSASLFYDEGRITQNIDNKIIKARPNSYSLKGWGLGLGWTGPAGLQLKATWATRIGSNPNPTVTGKDQDGSLDKDRFWLSASLPF